MSNQQQSSLVLFNNSLYLNVSSDQIIWQDGW